HAQGMASKTVIGYARIAGYANALKSEGKNLLMLDAGDTFHGQPWANLEKGATVAKLMNLVGYDAMTTGNHDYNYGIDRLVELSKMVNFPVVVANVKRDGALVFTPYVIKDVSGVRVAIFGLATPETLYKSDPAGLKGLSFEDPVATARSLIDKDLKGKYDVLICLAHLGIDASSTVTSVSVAKACPEINLIIDGHSHSSLQQEILNNPTKVLIVQADAMGVTLGRVDMLVSADRKVLSLIPQSVNLTNTPNMAADPAVQAASDAIVKEQAALLNVVIGQTAVDLVGARDIVRTRETNLGRLIANGMLATTGVDIALMNGGGIREGIPAGPITKKQVYTVLPFSNYLWTTTLTGAELKTVLENGVSKAPASDGRFPHLAGATFTYDISQPVGSRVTSIRVGGKPYDPAASYSFCTLNFEMNGGDEYTMLKDRKYKEFGLDADSFMAYLAKLGTVTEDNIVYRQ
ncbi:MAG TPA: bifunctional UDP-sugar hydrolase/5'-nucleotidase, partial [Rectinemataceae bacterium]|nr:bifunctional UDP-sugar hydrolase/5'-nucleotidase [Rectinemataceae bacterium]